MKAPEDQHEIAGHASWGGRIGKDIDKSPKGASIAVSISVVHTHKCPYWRTGKRHAPCTCGALELWNAFRERQGSQDPFGSIVFPGKGGSA